MQTPNESRTGNRQIPSGQGAGSLWEIPPQIGIRLHDTAPGTLEERLSAAKAQGFTCAHLALSKIPGLTAQSEALTPGYAAYLRHAFDRAQLDIAVLGNYLNLAHPDPDELAGIQERYVAHLRFAASLGCGMVGTETGAPNAAYKYDPVACRSQEALDAFLRGLEPVVRAAERFGVLMAIEPVYKHIVWNPRRARQVLDSIGSPNLRIIFDPVNLLHPDNLAQREEIIEEAIDLLGPDIAMIHLKDYRVEGEGPSAKMPCMGCGLGEMDYRRVLRFAKERKPGIHMTLENTKPGDAEGARKYIEQLYLAQD